MSTSTSARKSPRARTPRAVPAVSPTRITRLEEQEELQQLNQRLEFYIMKNREKDANQGILEREVEEARERFEADLKHAEELYQQQLNDLRKSRDEEKLAHARLNAEHKATVQDLEQTKVELAQYKIDQKRLAEDNEELQHELATKNLEVAQARDLAESLKSQLNVSQNKAESLATELENARDAEAEADERAQVAESRVKALESDYDTSNGKQMAEIKRLRREVDDLSRKNAHIEEELRRELTAQLGEILSKRQAEWEQEKNDGLAELKALYDEKISAYRDHLERAGHELEMLKSQRANALADVEQAKTVLEEFDRTKAAMNKRITELEDVVKAERARPARELAEKNEIIRRLKAAFKRKDEEFDQLMDTKIALAMEIRAYRALLEKEEQRLGYKSPAAGSKKRKLVPEPETQSSRDEDGATLRLTGCDIHGQYITIRNESLDEISLDGWSVRSQATGNELKLPVDISLPSGNSLTIWTGEDAESHNNPPQEIAWPSDEAVWDDVKGDTAELIDSDGNVVSSFELVPEHLELETDEDGDPVDAEGNKCAIM